MYCGLRERLYASAHTRLVGLLRDSGEAAAVAVAAAAAARAGVGVILTVISGTVTRVAPIPDSWVSIGLEFPNWAMCLFSAFLEW